MQIALTIAGSDSGGGAGIQADLKTFQHFGVFGTSVITAVTAQNTRNVRAVHLIPAEIVRAQLSAVAEDLYPAAVKTGMLGNAGLIREVAAGILAHHMVRYVLDPVMAASSGDRLLDPEAEREVLGRLVPLALLVTPNLEEAAALTGSPVGNPGEMERAGQRLVEAGARAALVKGGHLPGDVLVDVLVTPDSVRHFSHPRIVTSSTHGTGCTLSAAITAGLALGKNVDEAVAAGIDYVRSAIAAAPALGSGKGPVCHGKWPEAKWSAWRRAVIAPRRPPSTKRASSLPAFPAMSITSAWERGVGLIPAPGFVTRENPRHFIPSARASRPRARYSSRPRRPRVAPASAPRRGSRSWDRAGRRIPLPPA